MQSNYRMVMRSGPTVGKVYPLDKAEMFVGRDLNNDIVINDPEISRRHCRLYVQGNGYVLEDLGSTNGSFINGQRLLGPQVLHPGDTVTFGERLSLVFESAAVDQDATVVSAASRGAFNPQSNETAYMPPDFPPANEPAYPAPQPQYQQQPPQQRVQTYASPSYSGQVPDAYPMDAGQQLPAKPRSRTAWIIAIIIFLLLCICLALFLFFAPKEFWCLFPIWPAGACP